MPAIKNQLKTIMLFLSGIILLQSCSAYKNPVSLQQAVQEEKAVKVITVYDDTYKYKYIVYENGEFFGVKDNPGEDVKFPIDTEEVADIFMKSKTIPNWIIYVVVGVLAVGTLVAIIMGPPLKNGF